jgi:hypothetical protein
VPDAVQVSVEKGLGQAAGVEGPSDARYCPRCGRETPFEVYHVFDPAVRKREARLAKSIIRRYDERGIYYEWDDGPHGWD